MTDTYTRLNLADDLGQEVQLRRTQGGGQTGVSGEVRQYASGRLRAVTRAARPGTFPLTFRTRDRTIITTLQSWCGRTVLLRDPRGRHEWCVFFTVDETDSAPNWTEVTLSLTRVTTSLSLPLDSTYPGYLDGYQAPLPPDSYSGYGGAY